jgi:PAS domain S-box-containing protein
MNTPDVSILIVDDDPDILEATGQLLMQAGYAVESDTTGEHARMVIEAKRPDILLLDRDLPDIDGMELCRSIKADPALSDVFIVMISGSFVDSDHQAEGFDAGADDYIARPIENRELLARVGAFVRIQKLTRSLRAQTNRLKEQNEILRQQRIASLNLMEDAIEGRDQMEHANRALRESEERFRRVSAVTSDIAYSCISEGHSAFSLSWMSGAADSITGYRCDEILQRGCWSFLVHEDDRGIFRDRVDELLPGMQGSSEFRLRHKNGAIIWIASFAECVEDPFIPGRKVLYGGLSDITARRTVDEELRAAKERAEKSEKLKDAFVANMSHEIRTPLNIILGYTNVIAEKFLPTATPGDRRFFDSVQRGGERLMRTVDMILSVSRLQSGEYTVKQAEVDIAALVRSIAADHQRLAQEKQLQLSAVDDCGSVVLLVDEYCIAQAVSNLLHNAIKFTLRGSVQLRVYRDAEGRVAISCRDTGIGISREYLPRLFSRYSQEEAGYSRPFEGLGLGMALVKEYLALNNATISVSSEKGVGSTFVITFLDDVITPRQRVPAEVPARPALAAQVAPQQHLRTVLLVEDDEMTIEFMLVVLEEAWTVVTARSAEEARNALHANSIDIILMDVSLTGVQTGLQLTQEIRLNPAFRSIPIIAVTAHAYDSDRDNCLDAGCDDFIRKPVNSAFLLERMNALLAR